MAHITFKLIWYRLGESFDKMAAASENISGWLDWDDHLLDLLLFGWIGWAALVIFVVNSVLTFFGPLQPRMSWERTKEGVSGATVTTGTTGAESCQWLNSFLNWFYLHYDQLPEFVDVWVKALNDQVQKLGGPVQVKFERVKSGSLPPKFHDVSFEAGPEDKYLVHAKVDSRDLSFAVFASQQTTEGVKLTNLTASILKLKGTLRLLCYREGNDMMVNVAFEGRPDIKCVGKPVNPYQDPSDLVDVGVVETVVRNAICLASSSFNITHMVTGTSLITRSDSNRGNLSPRADLSPRELSSRTEAVFEPIEAKEQQSAFHAPPLQSAPRSSPRSPRQPPGDKRLLVKVIKASGLGTRDVGSIDPSCIVFLDSPPQSQATSIVKSTLNPFWDEQFLFDLSSKTQELRFEVVDRRKPSGENFLGEAIVYYEDLKRNPSSRQIIPLQGSPQGGDMVSGSITVEFLFLEAWEAEALRSANTLSPKRTVEVNQGKTPGGTLVTKTTTTTHRSQPGRYDTSVDGSPNYIEKRSNLFDYDGTDSYNSLGRSSPNASLIPQDRSLSASSEVLLINGVDSVAETAIRELMDRSRKPRTPTKTSTLIITGVKREKAPPQNEVQEDMVLQELLELQCEPVPIKPRESPKPESVKLLPEPVPMEPKGSPKPKPISLVLTSPTDPKRSQPLEPSVNNVTNTNKSQTLDSTISSVNMEDDEAVVESGDPIKKAITKQTAKLSTEETTESSPTEEVRSEAVPTVMTQPPPQHREEEKKKGSSLARTIKKRFSRSKKRSQSADRSTSLRDDSHLRPPEQSYGTSKSKDDIDLVRAQQETPNLKKSRSLGGSLKKLFRRGRKRSRSRGDTSRESSHSRSSTRNPSQGPSREGSLSRKSGSLQKHQRPPSGGSYSASNPPLRPTPQGPPSMEEQNIGRGHWTQSPQSGSPEIHTQIS